MKSHTRPLPAVPSRSSLLPTLVTWGVVGAIASTVFLLSPRTVPVLHIRADDVSGSAIVDFASLRQQHCAVSRDHTQIGDTFMLLPFADQPQVQELRLLNTPLMVQSLCQQAMTVPAQLGHHRGTSLILALKEIQRAVVERRRFYPKQPVVVTLTLQATEPGQSQPNPQDIQQVRDLVAQIGQAGGVIAIIGPTGELRTQLLKTLKDRPYQRICTPAELSDCVGWAFKAVRTQPTN